MHLVHQNCFVFWHTSSLANSCFSGADLGPEPSLVQECCSGTDVCCAVCAPCPVPDGLLILLQGWLLYWQKITSAKYPVQDQRQVCFQPQTQHFWLLWLGTLLWHVLALLFPNCSANCSHGCENISLNQTFKCLHTGTCILLSFKADPLQHQLPREQTGNTLKHWNGCIYCKESRGWYSNKLHSDEPTTTKAYGS